MYMTAGWLQIVYANGRVDMYYFNTNRVLCNYESNFAMFSYELFTAVVHCCMLM